MTERFKPPGAVRIKGVKKYMNKYLDAKRSQPKTEGQRFIFPRSPEYSGNGQRGQQVLHALRTFGDPLLDASEPRAYTSVQQMADVFFPKDALRYYWKGLYLDSLCDSVISRLADAFARKVSPLSMLVVWAQGGALTRVRVAPVRDEGLWVVGGKRGHSPH